MIVPKLKQLLSVFSSVLLQDRNTTCLRESQELSVVGGVNTAQEKGMVNRVNIAIQKCSTHCISTSTDNEITPLYVCLEPSGLESSDLLSSTD